MNFVEELKWRGMIQDITPGTEAQLQKEMTAAYVGFDPTADSLHIGNLVPIMLLAQFQRCGHKPIALVGGATGMIGDPSGKSEERKLLDEKTIQHNLDCQKKQLRQFLDFDSGKANQALMVNNFDWFKEMHFLQFLRDAGKHISVSYMMAKESVKKRLETGISFTEFSYQLIQAFDFYYLNTHHDCKMQMGGSDQWGNIVSGTELIRRKSGNEAFALTCPLITKADGSKFGKSEGGNVWLDAEKTSPYEFYQFWLNASDEDAAKYLRIFTFKPQDEIKSLEEAHSEAPHQRKLQKALAEDLTTRVHSQKALDNAVLASSILFGNATTEQLKTLSESDLLSVFKGVPQSDLPRAEVESGLDIIRLSVEFTDAFNSNGEARRMLQNNGLSLNKEKVGMDRVIVIEDLILNKYLLLQKGKKKYYLIRVI